MYKTIEIIKTYVPYNEQEAADKSFALNAIDKFDNILTRQNQFCHITANAFIVNQDFTKVLCCFHNIYKSWGLVGGHTDGIDDPEFVARKEAKEEAGISSFSLLQKQPISFDVLVTEGHFKRGKYVCSHCHINLCYLFMADDKQPIRHKEDENTSVKWIEIADLPTIAREDCMKKVYAKIIEKIELMNNKDC